MEIISLSYARPRREWIKVSCPWCGRSVRVGTREAVECGCGALHRWTGHMLYHIPSLRRKQS